MCYLISLIHHSAYVHFLTGWCVATVWSTCYWMFWWRSTYNQDYTKCIWLSGKDWLHGSEQVHK